MRAIERVLAFLRRLSISKRNDSGPTPHFSQSGSLASSEATDGDRTEEFATPKSNGLVVVGLDYGTHSTKALFCRDGEDKTTLVPLDVETKDYPWFASPSLVRRTGGRLFFGNAAAKRDGGELYERLKVQLLPPIQTREAEHATFRAGNGPPADILVAAYLAWTFTKIRKELETVFGSDRVNPYIQMAVPVNRNEGWRDSNGRYLRIMQAAWESVFGDSPLAGGIDNGVEEQALFQWLGRQMEKDPPEKGRRRFHLLPEAGAPIASLSQDPRLAPGVYELVDIGAGTTEFSVGEIYQFPDRLRSIQCIYATTIALGDGDLKGNARSDALRRLISEFKLAWENAYRMGPKNAHMTRKRWRGLTVILSGGGTLDPGVDGTIGKMNPKALIDRFGDDPLSYRVKKATQIGVVSPTRRIQSNDSVFLACGHGLALHGKRWPKYSTPEEYEAPPRDETQDLPPGWASPRDL